VQSQPLMHYQQNAEAIECARQVTGGFSFCRRTGQHENNPVKKIPNQSIHTV